MPRLAVRHRRLGDPGPGDPAAAPAQRGTGRLSPARKLGVEEEFLLADPVAWHTVPAAADVLARAEPYAGTCQPELRASQVEAATAIRSTRTQLHADLLAGRRVLGAAAERAHAVLVSSGAPVLAGPEPPGGPDARFALIDGRYRALVSGYQACGCHVHCEVPDRDHAVAVVNHLRPWLPTLLALSANSPFAHGRDTGYASWRIIEQSRFPAAGIPPWFASFGEYRSEVDRLLACGALVDDRMTFWLARPSPTLPTVEVRAADAATTADEALLQAMLTRALVDAALADLAAGREAPHGNDRVAAAALWSAARYGLTGPAVDPWHECARPANELVALLLERTTAALEETGDLALVRELLARLSRRGTGAQRQRRIAVHGLRGVMRALAADTLSPL
ncbi:carboxylate--amine ligase [Prauserella sp. PE36]|uniref:Putative glutamate--cysteine ligase 2 n=1 Tax=Prauserella endophytica TaxID=1592324 RepID=A0ABY2SA85_9PSEU|nr:carboxylate--amine ligase [Prauserella sp. PE36]TKG72416.1 YbdK family carboxylate-amine ligase [Prauserella endophytica]